MSLMPKLASSRALNRINQAIAAATDAHDAACLRAEHAALLARHGHLDEARAELDSLRRQAPVPRVQAWVALADGLAAYFGNLDGAAREQVRAAYDGSARTRQGALHALAAAWLAHMDYVHNDTANMVRHLGQALQLAAADNHAARSRASLVAALGYHLAGRFDLALPWYQAARRHATAEGDDATLSALMHNMAWQRGNRAREASIFGGADADEARQSLLGAESTGHFDAGLRTAALHSLVPILRAQILVALGDFAPALALYEQCLASALVEGLARLEGFLRADMAWCRVQLGDLETARADAGRAQRCLDDDDVDLDDRACAQGRLAQVFDALGDPASAARHRERAHADLASHRAMQDQLLALLQQGLKGLVA